MSKPNLKGYTKFDSFYDDAIIWSEYGYWGENISPPEWYNNEYVKEAKLFAKSLTEPKIELWFETYKSNHSYGGEWITYDSANKIIYFENGVGGCTSMQRAEQYIKNRHHEHERLFGEVIRSLLTYQQTGIACRPNWNNNKIDSYGFKNGKRNYVPKQKEVKIP